MSDPFRFASYDPELRCEIIAFHEKPEKALVGSIVRRIINHYQPKEKKIREDAPMDQPLAELGLDSLTLMEVTLDVQDAFQTTFTDEELKALRSFSEITALIDDRIRKLAGGGA